MYLKEKTQRKVFQKVFKKRDKRNESQVDYKKNNKMSFKNESIEKGEEEN